jgi:hypothetical protein
MDSSGSLFVPFGDFTRLLFDRASIKDERFSFPDVPPSFYPFDGSGKGFWRSNAFHRHPIMPGFFRYRLLFYDLPISITG